LAAGEIGFETDTGKFKIGNGSTAWASLAYSAGATAVTYLFNATGGQTTFSGADANGLTFAYTVGAEQVYLNGVLQVRGSDYTATNGTSIVLASGALVSDVLNVIAYSAMTITDTYTQAQADAKFFQTANAFLAGKNKIINGDFGVWQRGTSITIPAAVWTYHCDRYSTYQVYGTGSLVMSRQAFTPGTAPVAGYEGQYFLRATAPTSAVGEINFRQSIENVQTFAGQTVTFSFWAKASGTTASNIKLVQDFGSGGSSRVDSSVTAISIGTSWARYSMTVTLASIAGKTIGTGSFLDAYFYTNSAFTGGATIDFWGWQLEAGSIATPFQTATGTIQGELAACQRYYYASNAGICTAGIAPSGAFIYGRLVHPVPMRTTPSGSISPSGTTFTVTDDYSAAFSSSAVTGFGNDSWITSTSARVSLSGFTGLTGGRFYSVDGRSAGQIMFSAEL
jgi:hypothetical protein